MENNLKKLRLSHHLTQQRLSEKVLIEQGLLSKYERGIRKITIDNLVILADFYGVSTDVVLGREDVPEQTAERGGI